MTTPPAPGQKGNVPTGQAELLVKFNMAATNNPAANALVEVAGQAVPYRLLQQRIQELAVELAGLGISAGDRVGVRLPKSADAVAIVFAIWTVGAAYVPIDEHAPTERTRFILRNVNVCALISHPKSNDALRTAGAPLGPDVRLSGHTLVIAPFSFTPENTGRDVYPKDLACVLYTSGSTGYPKGVMLTHGNLACFVNWAIARFMLAPGETLSSIAPFHFDLSVFDLFAGLGAGATVVLFGADTIRNPRLLAARLGAYQVTTLYATPTLLQLLLRYGKLPELDYRGPTRLLYAGEPFPPEALNELRRFWPEAEVFNLYGPTETNVVTAHRVGREFSAAAIPIGRDCPYAESRLWDDGFLGPKPGTKGELWVAGASVAAGYVGKPDSEAFVEVEGRRWYKTGDHVRIDENGNYVFLGRRDRMIKRNGYRVEPAEIETCLAAHPSVASVAVLTVRAKNNRSKLLACLTLRSESNVPEPADLREYCLTRMPASFLPDGFRVLDELPLTASHKIDYPALHHAFSSEA